MTEMNVQTDLLPGPVERFVLHWGEMGTAWGVNRSVAQIHALLYLSDVPLTAEDIADRLGMARSNVSTSLRELLGWNLIRRVHAMGDRRDYYEAEADMFEMVRRIAMGRKAREIDPALAVLRSCLADAKADAARAAERAQAADRHARLHRDRRPQLRRDHAAAGADANGSHPYGRRRRALCRTQEQQEAARDAAAMNGGERRVSP